jgi:hypothetical protein
LWYVPGCGPPVAGSIAYLPAGTKNDATQTSSSTIARTVNAVGNLNFFAGDSVGGCCCDGGSDGVAGAAGGCRVAGGFVAMR